MDLKVFTQKEFDAIPRDNIGHKVCPTGNYSQMKEFPPYCELEEYLATIQYIKAVFGDNS